jgi:hypothetical protein
MYEDNAIFLRFLNKDASFLKVKYDRDILSSFLCVNCRRIVNLLRNQSINELIQQNLRYHQLCLDNFCATLLHQVEKQNIDMAAWCKGVPKNSNSFFKCSATKINQSHQK